MQTAMLPPRICDEIERLIRRNDTLWVSFLRAKYKIREIVPQTLRSTNGSRIWKGLNMVWEDIRNNIVWRVSSGENVNFWHDRWIDSLGPLVHHLLPGRLPHCSNIPVASMVAGNGEWKWNELDQLLPPYVLLHLAAIKCPLPSFGNDNVAWVMTNSGKFTVKSAYGVCAGVEFGPEEDVWKLIHNFKGTQRMKMFLWMVCHGRIMKNKERVRRHSMTDASCGICGHPSEDIDHVLRTCPHAFSIWSSLVQPSLLSVFMESNIKQWVRDNLLQRLQFGRDPRGWELIFGATCWYLWLYRNGVVFGVDGIESWSIMVKVREWYAGHAAGLQQLASATGSCLIGSHGVRRAIPQFRKNLWFHLKIFKWSDCDFASRCGLA
ncbi:hypothetical protein GQ457_07G010770 [Hibiscus cannabinus]